MSAKTCAHASCSCAVEPEELHCSKVCRDADDEPLAEMSDCPCGHVGCRSDPRTGQGHEAQPEAEP